MAELTITHTRTDGTLLDGSTTKGDGVNDLIRPYGFRWFRSLEQFGITRSRDREAQHWRINGAAAALREAGHQVTIEINEDDRRSFTEAEADRTQRSRDRADRYSDHAQRAAASSDARYAAARDIADSIPLGQPILVGHHSERRARRDVERMDSNMGKAVADGKRAEYWDQRAEAAEGYEAYRNDAQRTRRRIHGLRARLRKEQMQRAEALVQGWPSANLHDRRIRDLVEEIDHWEGVIKQAEADGIKFWGPDDFVPGDFVRYSGSWYEIKRVNPKTLSIAWNLRLAPKQVMSIQDATVNGTVNTFPADYTKVTERCPGDAMRAFLTDGLVPGSKAAREASDAAPADAIRQAQQKTAKPRKRSDPAVPKRIKLQAGWDATEATVTWLTGRSQPHPKHPPETLTAPEGTCYTGSVYTPALRDRVTRLLTERGYTYRGSWTGSPAHGITCAITTTDTPETPAP